ncbi:hypothetical protein [Bradyrhizobium sp. 930_D9_N1_4]|uniref:hypothetical protein n=1 Tax=Bradyrhizobium sp. 930_D9_N1_4 TaxID=3240374 RepID=UPI003F89FAA4
MKIVTALAVVAMLLLNAFGPDSSVGGPLASFFGSVLIAWAVGLHFAWSKRFGLLGWLLSMVTALAGGVVGIILLGTVMDAMFELAHFQGRLIDSNWSCLAFAAMALAAVLGAWAPLELGNRSLALRRSKLPALS